MDRRTFLDRLHAPDSGSPEFVKWLALFAMVIDHFAFALFDQGKFSLPYSIGRIAFPLFCLILAFKISRPRQGDLRFLLVIVRRLLLFGCASALPYYFAFRVIWPINVFFTLGFGVSLCYLVATDIGPSRRWTGIILVFLISFLCDYLAPGVFLVMFLFLFFRRPTVTRLLIPALLLFLLAGMNGGYAGLLAVPIFLMTCVARVPVPTKKRVFYLIYPAHLLVLAAWNVGRVGWPL